MLFRSYTLVTGIPLPDQQIENVLASPETVLCHARFELFDATFTGAGGERYYQGRIVLDRNYVGQSPQNRILPGMTVMAEIITGRKTLLDYLLKPVHNALKTAFSER